jgi:hypothetical protein
LVKVIDTAERRNESVFRIFVDLLGWPVIPYLSYPIA